MKKIIVGALTVGMLLSHLSIVSANEGKSDVMSSTNYSINGDNLTTFVFQNYEKEANFELYNIKKAKVYRSTTTSSRVVGTFNPIHWKSYKRSGDWFYVKSAKGNGWIRWDDKNVFLREIIANNTKIQFSKVAYVHSKPFKEFKTKKKVAPGIYAISQRAGDWFYVKNIGWIYEKYATYPGVIKKMNVNQISTKKRNIPIKQSVLPISEKVRYGGPLQPRYITIHNTSVKDRGANAKYYAKYLADITKSQTRYASWHYSVDDKEIYQHLPLNEHGWHAGDDYGPGNTFSVGIEITENKDGVYKNTQENAAYLTASLLLTWNVPYNQISKWVVPQKYWSGKNCPAVIFSQPKGFEGFLNQVRAAHKELQKSQFAKPSLSSFTVSDRDVSIKGKASKSVKAKLYINDKFKKEVKVNKDGKFYFSLSSKLKGGTDVKIMVLSQAGLIDSKSAKVLDKTAPSNPTVNKVNNTDTSIKGKAEANTSLVIVIASKTYRGKANAQGEYVVSIPTQKSGTNVDVYAQDAAGNKSALVRVVVL